MKRLLFAVSFIIGTVFPVYGQKMHVPIAAEPAVQIQSTYPVAGSDLLRKEWEKIGLVLKEYTRAHPQPQSMKKAAAWNFHVGDTHAWWATDLSGFNQFEYQVPSTCRAIGTHCYIFVEDAMWGTRANQEAVDSMQAAFDLRTPADPTKGIYKLDTQYYGNPPNVDGDPKIIILILDIRDGYSGSGGYVAGYFYGINEYTDSEVQQALGSNRHSNDAEIYYVDCNPANLMISSGMTIASSTTAHEFQHMIHFNYDPEEIAFVNEGLSEAAEKLCGYGLRSPSLYYANTNVNFIGWSDSNSLPDYSRAALFTWYLIEQFGAPIAKDIVQSTSHSFYGYNDAFSMVGTPLRFLDVLKNFAIAAGLNDTTVDSRYGFKQVNITNYPVPYRTYNNPNVPVTNDTLEAYGTRYITFTNTDSLSATFTFNNTVISVHAIGSGSAGKKVSDVTSNTPYLEDDPAKQYDKEIFVVTNISGVRSSYQYTASGASGVQGPTEIAYDDGNPEGYYTWTTGDSVAVQFDAVPGAVLDSIRVAFRRAGTISYGIWKYSGGPSPSPFAQNYGKGSMVCTDSTHSVPYPVPYQNWVKTDVSGWNVDLNYPFVVGFAFGANSTAPGLMMSAEPYTEPHHSFTYFKGSGVYGWYILVTNDAQDSAANYLVRAYVHYGTIVINSPVLVSPTDSATDQPVTLTLNWTAPSGAAKYHLQVSTSSLFDTLAINDSTLTTTSKQVGPLSFGTVYFWRVRASNSVSTGSFSPFSRFTTIPSPPAVIMANTTISFPKKGKASDYSATDYRIIGLPGVSNIDIGSILTGAQNTDWQVYWDDGTNSSDSLKVYDGSSEFVFSTGRAFWVISRNDITINRSINSAPLNSSYEVEIPLHNGWNLITNPFASSIAWSKIQNANGITSSIFLFDSGSFSRLTNFDPYAGYYLFNGTPNTTLSVLKVPYEAIYTKRTEDSKIKENGWRVNVELLSDGIIDSNMQFGVSEFSKPGLDVQDVRKPRAVGLIPEVYFERKSWDIKYPAFAADIRPPFNELEQWTFTLKSEPRKPVSLTFKGIASVPQQYEVYLIDLAQAKSTDLRKDSVYEFVPVSNHSEYSVSIGKKDAVLKTANDIMPTEFSLGQNFPNPFNPATSFAVRIPSSSFITLKIYNVLGQPVRSLYSGNLETGQHWFIWDGKNDVQGSLPSGVYYCRMDIPGVNPL